MKANATVSVRRNTVRNKTNTKTRTTGKNHAKKNTDSPFAQTTAFLPVAAGTERNSMDQADPGYVVGQFPETLF